MSSIVPQVTHRQQATVSATDSRSCNKYSVSVPGPTEPTAVGPSLSIWTTVRQCRCTRDCSVGAPVTRSSRPYNSRDELPVVVAHRRSSRLRERGDVVHVDVRPRLADGGDGLAHCSLLRGEPVFPRRISTLPCRVPGRHHGNPVVDEPAAGRR